MIEKISLDLGAMNQYIEVQCGGKEVYFGFWSANDIDVNVSDISENIEIQKGRNWFALRNGADKCRGILFPNDHIEADKPELVVFRGYLCDAQIHSYSSSKDVRHYWSENLYRRHNGIFSSISISNNGEELNFVTDIFGLAPIYYRQIGEVVFFASCSSLLSMKTDKANIYSWFLNLAIGFTPGNETLTKEIKQPEPASITTYTAEGRNVELWYDNEYFPNGDGEVTDDIYALSHKCFNKSVLKLLNLRHGKQILPLSGGYDSRRIFGHIIDSKIPFEGCSVQMTTSTGEDIDLYVGKKLARDYGIKHVEIKVPDKEQWQKNDARRILSMDGQTQAHTWSVPIFNYYNGQHISIYDGLGGDIFGFHGLRVNEVKNIETPIDIPRIFKSEKKPSQEKVTAIIDLMKSKHVYGPNHGLLTFLKSVSRKSTSLWAQQQIRPGQLVLYPYLDLDYVEMMFSYSYKEKEYERAQLKIIEKFWPKLAAYPSSWAIPEGTSDLTEIYNINKNHSFNKLIRDSFQKNHSTFHYSSLLNFRSRLIIYMTQFNDMLKANCGWWSRPIVEYMYWWQSRPFVIKINKDEKE